MQRLDFYLGSPLQYVPPPDNWQSLQLELSFENGSPEGVLNSTILVWKAENAALMNQSLNSGLNGGFGIFEGIPLQIKICDTQQIVFNGIVDLTDPDVRFNCDIVKCRIRDKRMDMINQLFDSISFAYLATPASKGGAGIINPNTITNGGDYFPISYQRNNIPDVFEAMTTILTLYETVELFYKILTEVLALISGTAGTAAAGGFGGTVLAVIELLAWILELVLMILVLIKLVTHFLNEVIGPIPSYKKLGMKVLTAAQKACSYFGIQFSSSILQGTFKDLVWMPSKAAWENNRKHSNVITSFFNILGAPNYTRMNFDDEYNLNHGGDAYGYPDNTVGDFFRKLEDVFDAKMKIIMNALGNPVLHFERWNYQYNLSTYQLPNISEQAPFPQAFGTNASELAANYLIKWQVDNMDLNTKHVFEGISCYAQISPIVVGNAQNRLLKNLTELQFGFSLGIRKDRLTLAENVFDALWNTLVAIPNLFISAINGIIGLINSVLNFLGAGSIPTVAPIPTNPLAVRLGNLLLSNDVTDTPKLLLCMANGDLYSNNHTLTDPLSARNLFKNFHYSSLAQTLDPSGKLYTNQYRTYVDQEIPMCCEEYEAVKNNNYIRTFEGDFAKVTSLKWNVFHGTARIDYRVNKPFTKNLKTSFVIDGATTVSTL